MKNSVSKLWHNCFENYTCVQIIHDFASEGWEQRAEYNDFGDWMLRISKVKIAFGGKGFENK
ncbi:MAG: hypothetical protein K2O32_07900 [Acetatifactor sp.]|nr:hypothetical protein [Acetatifactor sp.]